jgi:quercetin dioxygenase-like cupin family protein
VEVPQSELAPKALTAGEQCPRKPVDCFQLQPSLWQKQGVDMPVKHSTDVEAKNVAAGKDTTIQVLISSQEGPNFALRKFSMQKGGGMPRHTNTVEHEQYVLRGEATITIGDETHHVKTGDVVFIPGGAIHSYENVGEEPFEFLCIIPNKEYRITIMEEAC